MQTKDSMRQTATRFLVEPLEQRRLLSAPGAAWPLVFDDEFNSTSLDTTKWSLYLPWSNSVSGDNRYHSTNGNYLSYMMPDDVVFPGNGTLDLNTEKRNETAPSGHVFNYTEGMITTASKFTTAYGYFEIRAKLPTGAGNWPAFWMTNGWPPEDDIMEAWPATSTNHQGLYGMNSTWYNVYPSYSSVSSGWHTWSMEWGPGYQTFYIDGVATETINNTSAVPSSSNPEYLLLNSGVQNGQTANYSNSNNNTLQVDYVRVWGYSPSSGIDLPNPGFESTGAFTSPYGGGSIGNYSPRTGNKDLRLVGTNSGDEYTITGLAPNTTYTFSGFGQANAGNNAYIGVKDYGGSQLLAGFSDTSWTQNWVTFTTGATNTAATLFLYKNSGSGYAYFDDLQFSAGQSSLNAISTQQMSENTATSVPLSLTNSTNKTQVTGIVASSSNPTLVSPDGVGIVYLNGQLNLQISRQSNQTGSASLTVTVIDANGMPSTSQTFTVNVNTFGLVEGDQNSPGQNDVFRLVRSGDNLQVFLNSTTVPVYDQPADSVQLLELDGLGGDDAFTVDFSGGNPLPSQGINIAGGTSSRGNSLLVTGIDTDSTLTLTASSIVVNGQAIVFSDIQRPALELASGAQVTMTAQRDVPATALTIDAGASATLTGSSNIPNTTALTVNGALTISDSPLAVNALTGAGSIQFAGALSVGNAGGSGLFTGAFIGSGSLTKNGAGNFVAADLPGGTITVNGGKLALTQAGGVQAIGGLAIASNATMDLADNDLLIRYAVTSPLDTITGYIKSAYNNGHWNLPGLTGSNLSTDLSLGIADSAQLDYATFDNIPLNGPAIMIKQTRPGDANLDGRIDADDLSLIVLAKQQNLINFDWPDGDFNYDARLNADDFMLMALGAATPLSPTDPGPSVSVFQTVRPIAILPMSAAHASINPVLNPSDSDPLLNSQELT